MAEDRELHDTFDYVTAFDAIHDQTKPVEALKGIFAVLKDGGAFSMVDIAASSDLAKNMDHPMGMFLYTVRSHALHAGGSCRRRHGTRHDVGTGKKPLKCSNRAGFTGVSVEGIPNDPFNLHFFCKK